MEKGANLWNNNPHKKRHNDIKARWTKKNNETYYGYKNHAKVDTKNKFFNTFSVTSASVHDSKTTNNLLNDSDLGHELHAVCVYAGENQETIITKYKMINKLHERGYKNNPITEAQNKSNAEKSNTQARVEHVFGFMEKSMNGLKLK